MTPDSKRGILSKSWVSLKPLMEGIIRSIKSWVSLKSFREGIIRSISGAKSYPMQAVNYLLRNSFVLGAGAASPFAVTTLVQNNVENYQLVMAPIYFQINEFNTQLNKLISVVESKGEIAKFRIDPLLFLKARLKNQTSTLKEGDNCESVLDYSEGNGIGLSKWQEQQLDRLVILVDILDVRREIVLHLEGFASELEFTDFSRDTSNKCNLLVANSRAEKVGKYLEKKLLNPRVLVENKTWNKYKEMDENRYYLYEPRPSIEYPDGLHALNQAVYITIALR